MSKVKTLTQQLLQDRERRRAVVDAEHDHECVGCGKGFTYRGPRGDNSGRFCSDQCRLEFDIPGIAFDPFKPTKWRAVAGGDPGHTVAAAMVRVAAKERADRILRGGWRIECRGCGRRFESMGVGFCSPDCRRSPAGGRAARAAKVPTGKRSCERCGGEIPRWGKRGATRKDARVCGRC